MTGKCLWLSWFVLKQENAIIRIVSCLYNALKQACVIHKCGGIVIPGYSIDSPCITMYNCV